MENKNTDNVYKLVPRGYNPNTVWLTLWRFFHILQKIEEEQEEENYDDNNLSQSI